MEKVNYQFEMALHHGRYVAQVLDRIIVPGGAEREALRREGRHRFDYSLGLGFRSRSREKEREIDALKEERPERSEVTRKERDEYLVLFLFVKREKTPGVYYIETTKSVLLGNAIYLLRSGMCRILYTPILFHWIGDQIK